MCVYMVIVCFDRGGGGGVIKRERESAQNILKNDSETYRSCRFQRIVH